MKQLTKLTQYDGKDLYVDLTKVTIIRESKKYSQPSNSGGNYPLGSIAGNSQITPYISIYNDEFGNTCFCLDHSSYYYVMESLPEVLALIEGRDPRPAKVLYGNNK